jgi:hypothetical protein
MPRSHRQLKRSAERAAATIHALVIAGDPGAEDLEMIAVALCEIVEANEAVARAVARARANGQSWSRIAMALGTSKQSAVERYGTTMQPFQ